MTFPVNIKHGAKNRCWTFDKRKQFIECHIKWLERNSIFISERLSNISHLWNCVSPHNTFSTQVNLQKMNSNNIKGLINAYLAVAQHRAGGDVAFHSVKCCMCTHGSWLYGVLKHAGSENDRWFCSSALSSRLQPHGSVAPFLCISWWGKMRQVSALTEGSNVKQTPSCLCCMYERKTIELMGNDERQKLGSNFLLNTKPVLTRTKQGFIVP